LPPEARHTHRLILKGGPFPYDKDGTVFGNRERLLPRKARGYYREYTVKTPGARNRGAKRIVCGGKPPTQS
jgi:ribonuclease T1